MTATAAPSDVDTPRPLAALTALAPGAARLRPGLFEDRRRLNRDYLRSLRAPNLLQNHLIEAGIGSQAWHLHPSRDGRRRIPRARPPLGVGDTRIAPAGTLRGPLALGRREGDRRHR